MRIIYWLGIAFLWMLPLNVLLLTGGKPISGDALGEEELVGSVWRCSALWQAGFSIAVARGSVEPARLYLERSRASWTLLPRPLATANLRLMASGSGSCNS